MRLIKRKEGALLLDVLVATAIFSIMIAITYSIGGFYSTVQSKNLTEVGYLTAIENHLEEVASRSSWQDLDATNEELVDGVNCSIVFGVSVYNTEVLTIEYTADENYSYTFKMERSQ